jgi:hypothetical protein
MAEQIKDTNVIKTPEALLHPTFFLPPDVVDMFSGTSVDTDVDSESVDDTIEGEVQSDYEATSGESSNEETDVADTVFAPQWMTIISQSVKISSDGTATVDVVVEFEDVFGNTEYDVRVTKA